MNFRWHTRVLLALGSGAALALSFPNYNLSLLAWVAVGMLVLASCEARPAVSPVYGFLHGLVFYPVGLPWIAVVMEQYGNIDPFTSAGILGLMAIAGGIVCSFFSLGVALVSRRSNALACLLAPCLWATLEFARTHLPIIGFPWNLTGYAASGNLALVQLAPLTGIYGLTFVIGAYGSVLAYAILSGHQRVWKATLIVTAVLILIAAGGGYFVPKSKADHVAHLVQTNFPQSEHYPPNWLEIHAGEMDELERISVNAAQNSPGLIIWPEVPAPFSLQENAFAERASRIARESQSDFVVGVVDWKLDASRKYYAMNSAVLLDPSGQRVFTYDKIHLVPFGEYVPLRQWIKFAGRLTADISDFTPGTEYRVGQLPVAPAEPGSQGQRGTPRQAGGKFGVFICYEAIFPDEIRRFAQSGAELLINVSNDGWFGRSSAPAQHLMMARVRAVENRRWLLRDTNNGYTVDVDPYGRIVASTPTDIRGELDAPYAFRSDLTPYTRFGDWFAWLCVIASVALLAFAVTRKMDEEF
jgi:apolipoprotein N-acyltransferase